MAMAITRHAALKSRMPTPSAQESTASVLEMAKQDVAKQRQKAQVVLRNPPLSRVKCVKTVKPRGGSLHSTINGVKPTCIPVSPPRPYSKCFPPTNSGRLKLVTPRLPWNSGKVQSKTDSGLFNRGPQRSSVIVFKDPNPKLRKPSNYLIPADRDKPMNNSTSSIPVCVNGNVVMRRPKSKIANTEQVAVKRRSRSLESLMDGRSDSESYLSPTQCFKCRKDMSRVLDSSTSDVFSEAYSSASDLNGSLPELELQLDHNNNEPSNRAVSRAKTEELKAEKLVHHPPVVDIVSDIECYKHQLESDSQADSDYGTSVVSDSEVYRYKSKIKDRKSNLYLDSPRPHLLRQQRSESAGSVRDRKIQIEHDLDSLLDSMAFALENYDTKSTSNPDNIVGSAEDPPYSPPTFFRPIFEVKI